MHWYMHWYRDNRECGGSDNIRATTLPMVIIAVMLIVLGVVITTCLALRHKKREEMGDSVVMNEYHGHMNTLLI